MALAGLLNLSKLSDARLVDDTVKLVRQRSSQTALIVAHLVVIARRQAHRALGYSSLYRFCVQALHLGEQSAYKHVWAVGLARRCPQLLDAIAKGRVHLAGVCELARHMTTQNAAELLDAATHKTRREIQCMLAERFPKPDVPTLVMALPGGPDAPESAHEPVVTTADTNVTPMSCKPSPGKVSAREDASVEPSQDVAPTYSRITPIAPARFAMQLTICQRTHDLLQRAKELLAHSQPGCDLPKVLELALAEFVKKLEKRKFGDTHAPKARRASGDSRYIPADVKRRVAERDGKQCTFVSENGVRCDARERLEYDHVTPFARGGRSTVENVRMRCHAHNQLYAEQVYGAGFMDMKRGHGHVRERARISPYARSAAASRRRFSCSRVPPGTAGSSLDRHGPLDHVHRARVVQRAGRDAGQVHAHGRVHRQVVLPARLDEHRLGRARALGLAREHDHRGLALRDPDFLRLESGVGHRDLDLFRSAGGAAGDDQQCNQA
jgi:hypothetical protein